MNPCLKTKIELFADGMQSFKGNFIWKNISVKRLAALLYAARDKQIDLEALEESHQLIKKQTGAFSYFRGNSGMIIATLLALNGNRDKDLQNTLTVYDSLKKNKFWGSDYLVVAAYQIASSASEANYEEVVKRTKGFYDGMKARHRWITGQNDYIFAALLGLSDLELEKGLEQMEELYETFKPAFRSRDGIQTMAQIFTLSGVGSQIESRVLSLREKFHRKKMRLDQSYTLASLGVLAMLPVNEDILVSDVIETYDILRSKKGFGSFSITKQQLLILASALVSFGYVDEANSHLLTSTLSTSITNIIIAQQTAIAVIVATSASVSSN